MAAKSASGWLQNFVIRAVFYLVGLAVSTPHNQNQIRLQMGRALVIDLKYHGLCWAQSFVLHVMRLTVHSKCSTCWTWSVSFRDERSI